MLWKRAAAKVAKTSYDYVIVGGGSAGCVMANRLTENGHKRVLLLEAGPSDVPFHNRLGKAINWTIHMPSALMYNLGNDKYNWFYHTKPQANINDRTFYWPRGRVLGGSSSLNAMVYVRGHAEDQNRWARECGDETWNYDHMLPYFKRAQCFYKGGDLYRGGEGPLHVTDGSYDESPLFEAFVKAGMEAGYPGSDDLNGYQQEGFGRLPCTVNIHEGTRWNTASAYLRPALNRPNLDVLTDTFTEKIIFEGTTATGVEISHFKKADTKAKVFGGEVILCGGAINSPQLLLQSGIGNADELKAVGIKPVINLPGVGENLQDHLEVYVQHKTTKGKSLYKFQHFPLMQAIGVEWFLRGKGVCAGNHLHAGAFIRSRADPEINHPDIQFHFLPSQVIDHGRIPPREEAFQVHVGTLRAKSKGYLKLKSNNPRDHPIIDPKYFTDPADLPDLVAAVKLTREIFAQKALDEYRLDEIIPGPNYQTDQELGEWVKEVAETAYHPSCSNKMGTEDDPWAVVNSDCQVFGAQKLRVIDSSIMPSVASGNLNAPTIAIAERASDIVRGLPPLHMPNTPVFQPDTSKQR